MQYLDVDNKIKTGCSKLNINNNGLSSNEEVKNIKKEIYEEIYNNFDKKDRNTNCHLQFFLMCKWLIK